MKNILPIGVHILGNRTSTHKPHLTRTAKATPSRKKVYVGMSGGVDSSVSAALLTHAGYDVTGVFIQVWQPDWLARECTSKEDRLDAMRVAAHLGITFITLNLEEEYKREVVDYMIAEYKAGRTPNPDVMCNTYVKFGGFFDWAMKQGADFVATGHYAQVRKNEKTNVYELLAGNDQNKDQSYFLWTLTQKHLAHTLFPVGNIEKPEVRKLAKKFGLPTAEKKDSQGLCFIGKIDVKDFLSHYIDTKKGHVLDVQGNVIGMHDGAFFFTIGERHGFSIDDAHKTPNDAPLYVIAKNIEKNTITVAQKAPDGALPNAVQDIRLEKVNWFSGEALEVKPSMTESQSQLVVYGRPRYRAPLVPLTISFLNSSTHVHFHEPQYTLSPGQSLVLYKKDDENNALICLGGGIIS